MESAPPSTGCTAWWYVPYLPVGTRYVGALLLLAFGFLFSFTSYAAAQNIESSLNSKGSIGVSSLGLLYLMACVSSLLAPTVVAKIGSRAAMVVQSVFLASYVASNLLPTWFVMLGAALIAGAGAPLLWTAQNWYIKLPHCVCIP